MSHHVSASATNPSGAVEVVRVASSATTQAPVDAGGATGGAGAAGGNAPIATGGAAPTAGSSGTPGANLPVDEIQQASNTIQSAKADLSRTTGAERRLDGLDGVGGGGGGAAAGDAAAGDAAAGDATVAEGTDQLDSEKLAENTSAAGANGQQISSTADSSAAASGGIEGNEQQGSSLNQLGIAPTGGTTGPVRAT